MTPYVGFDDDEGNRTPYGLALVTLHDNGWRRFGVHGFEMGGVRIGVEEVYDGSGIDLIRVTYEFF